MPRRQLDGDMNIRSHSYPRMGRSCVRVVFPGHEEAGIWGMPGAASR